MLKQIKFKINGDTWIMTLYDQEHYIQLHGKHTCAMTMPELCTIDFVENEFDVKTVRHELIHAHIKYLYLESSNISLSSFEEIMCDLISDRLDLIKEQADTIYKKLKV